VFRCDAFRWGRRRHDQSLGLRRNMRPAALELRSALYCVAVCCSVLQCVAVWLQCAAVCCSVFAVCCSVLQCAAVCCSVLQCAAMCCNVLQCTMLQPIRLLHRNSEVEEATGWRRLIGCLKLQVIFRKRATEYRALLWKMTCKDKASYGSSPLCMRCLTSGPLGLC